ncbi:polar amino acid transport system substrate-binding protein [Duganella sp. 1224]|uniref:substrate-binding periplasmic protein n=1 Tax=Duganella sp. 1224 TaxID=2587052 RepID=UPI0015C78726|nr:transporter substrate-binding domain-containing protein [Duganella sp. 1224]NYE61980.1 polar amino acid transport system substrate-binding protein [Duganella sp. 1224]
MRFIFLTLFLLATCARAAEAPLYITTEHAPPSSMRGDDGVVTGRATEKIRALMARTGTDYRIEQLPWKRALMLAQTRDHTCVYSTSRTPEREARFKWIGPTDEAEWQFWGRADHAFPLNTVDDARKLRIGTAIGDARDDYLRNRGFNVDAASSDLANPHKLLLNRIDLWAVAVRNGSAGPSQPGWAGKVVPLLVFHRVQVYLACNRAMPDQQVEQLNAALAELRRDGTLARIDRKYEHGGQ